jgi:hypothetical protein
MVIRQDLKRSDEKIKLRPQNQNKKNSRLYIKFIVFLIVDNISLLHQILVFG